MDLQADERLIRFCNLMDNTTKTLPLDRLFNSEGQNFTKEEAQEYKVYTLSSMLADLFETVFPEMEESLSCEQVDELYDSMWYVMFGYRKKKDLFNMP